MANIPWIFRSGALARFVLVLGWVAYLIICLPILGSSGYDGGPFWDAMPVLWLAPLIISRLLDVTGTPRRWKVLAYGLACGLVAAGLPLGRPSFFSPAGTLAVWVIVGPLFVALAWLVEILTWLVMRVLMIPAPLHGQKRPPAIGTQREPVVEFPNKPYQSTTPVAGADVAAIPVAPVDSGALTPDRRRALFIGRRLMAAALVTGAAVAAPFLNYIRAVRWTLPAEARSDAERVWRSRQIRQIYLFNQESIPWKVHTLPGHLQFTELLEPTTGTNLIMGGFWPYWPWDFPRGPASYRKAFYAELASLIQSHGVPAWSLKNSLMPEPAVLELLYETGFTAIKKFPHAINQHLSILSNHEVDGVQKPIPEDAWFASAVPSAPVAFKILKRYHGDIAVRRGPKQLAVFSANGHLLYVVAPLPIPSR